MFAKLPAHTMEELKRRFPYDEKITSFYNTPTACFPSYRSTVKPRATEGSKCVGEKLRSSVVVAELAKVQARSGLTCAFVPSSALSPGLCQHSPGDFGRVSRVRVC